MCASALPRVVAQLESQRNSLKNAQVHLKEEVRSLRSELDNGKRQSRCDLSSSEDEVKRARAAQVRAEGDRDQFEADLILAHKQAFSPSLSI